MHAGVRGMGLCPSEPWRLLKMPLLQCMASLLVTGMSPIALYLFESNVVQCADIACSSTC